MYWDDAQLYDIEGCNTEETGSIKIINFDTACSDILLEGSAFDIYNCCGSFAGHAVTDRYGSALLCYFPAGYYVILEVKSAAGYYMHTAPFFIKVNKDSTTVLYIESASYG